MYNNEGAKLFLKVSLAEIIKRYIGVMNEFDNDELVTAFESIMSLYSEEIKPYLLEICQHLKQ